MSEKQNVEEIEIVDQPGVAPGVSFGDILKYLPLIERVISGVVAGEGEFIVRTPLGRKRITIANA